jgi:hypothetical protein
MEPDLVGQLALSSSKTGGECNLAFAYSGVKLLKCVEGQHNKAFILTMNNGREVLAKIPHPNAGPAFYTTASEVATRQFVCNPKLVR